MPVLLAVLAGTAVALGAGPASAHNVLRSSTPEDGAVLTEPPAEVLLQFDEAVVTLGTEVALAGPDGVVEATDPVDVRGSTVAQPLPAGLPAGTFTVRWRATSADGHPVSGELSFSVEQAGSDAARDPAGRPAGEPSPDGPPADASADGGADGMSAGATAALMGGGLAALVAAVAVVGATGRRARNLAP